nr:restriction endonuclease subunit S [Mesonia hippocampi]
MRFPGFHEEWEEKSFKELTKINQGLQIAISERYTEKVEGGYFYITNEFLKAGNTKKYYIKNPPKSVLCSENDVLMTRTGNTGMVVTGVSGAFHNNFFKIKFNDESLDKDFLVHFLKSHKIQCLILRLAGTSTIPDLNHSDFYRITIVKPQLFEQKKIASFINLLNSSISTQNKIIEDYKTLKKGVMQKIFKQEIRFKDKDGKEFPKWQKKKLGLFLIQHNEKTKYSDQYPVLTSSRQGIMFQTEYYSGNQVASKDNTGYNVVPRNYFTYRHMSDDLVFKFNRNTICEKGIVSTLYPVFSAKNINDKFLEYKLNDGDEVKKYALLQKQGGSRTYLYFKKLSNMNMNLPCLEEQQKIASTLSTIDKKIALEEDYLDKLKAQKKYLLQNMFI